MEKKIGTNLNWEKLIDSLSIEIIQKDNNNHSDSKIYENQFDAAKKFVKAMMSYYIPGETEFTSRNHHLLVSALPQSGKTGFMAAVANIIRVTDGLMNYLKINSIWFITGMNDTGLQKQTAERIAQQVIGATDENIDSGKNDKIKSKDSFFKVFRNQELRNPQKLLIGKGELKNALIFIDEAHYGTSETSKLHGFFKYHGLDFKNRTELMEKAIYITSISATNTSEIFSDLSDSKQHIILEPSNMYYGPEEMLYLGQQIYQASNTDFKLDKKTNEYPIISMIKDAYNNMCKFAYEDIIPRYHTTSPERDYSPRGCCFIRASKKIDGIIKKNEWIKEYFQIIQIDTSSSKKVNYDSVFTEFKVMLNAPNQKPVIFLVKGGYRAGITKHPQIKDYTFMIYDRSTSILSTIQGLLGRMCGVRENWDLASWTKFYVEKDHVVEYVKWHMAKFNRENVPGKPTFINSTNLSRKEIIDIVTNSTFDKDIHQQISSEFFEDSNIVVDLTEEQILKIYDIHKQLKQKIVNPKFDDKNSENRVMLEDIILNELGLVDKYDFIAEIYLSPGGLTEHGMGIDGREGHKYSQKFKNDWWEGKGVGGVREHGHKHFNYLYGRNIEMPLDEGKIAAHVVLNDDKKQLRLILRKLVCKYLIYKQDKWFQSHKDTSDIEVFVD